MKIRTGVVSSQWAGECGENSYSVTPDAFAEEIREMEQQAAENATKTVLHKGDIVSVAWAGTDPDSLEVTQIVEALDQDRTEWTCEQCNGIGCGHCNDGFRQGEDRFVIFHNGAPYLALTQYHEIVSE